jgi:hypothetical protein
MPNVSGRITHEHFDRHKTANSVGVIAILIFLYAYKIGLLGRLIAIVWPFAGAAELRLAVESGSPDPLEVSSFTFLLFRVVEFGIGAAGTLVIAMYSGLAYVFNDLRSGSTEMFNRISKTRAERETRQAVAAPIAEAVVDSVNSGAIQVPAELAPIVKALKTRIAQNKAAHDEEILLLRKRLELVEATSPVNPRDIIDLLSPEEQVVALKAIIDKPKPTTRKR